MHTFVFLSCICYLHIINSNKHLLKTYFVPGSLLGGRFPQSRCALKELTVWERCAKTKRSWGVSRLCEEGGGPFPQATHHYCIGILLSVYTLWPPDRGGKALSMVQWWVGSVCHLELKMDCYWTKTHGGSPQNGGEVNFPCKRSFR